MSLKIAVLPTDKIKDKHDHRIILSPSNHTCSGQQLAVRNTGDAHVYDLDDNVTTGLQSALGINDLTPSAITIPFNIIPLSYTSQQIICYIQSETFSSIVLCNSLL